MTYRQDATNRACAICSKRIKQDEWMMDLFRHNDSLKRGVMWVHETCARTAIETWLNKKLQAAQRKAEDVDPS